MARRLATLTEPEVGANQSFTATLRGSRVVGGLHRSLVAVECAWMNSRVFVWQQQWAAVLPVEWMPRLRFWSVVAGVAMAVHLVLLLFATAPAPWQWVLPAAILAAAAVLWVTAPAIVRRSRGRAA